MADSQNNQPTILVKKADGSSIRVTMAEFAKMKEKNTPPPATPAPSQRDNEEAKKNFNNLKEKLNVANQKIADAKKVDDVKPEIKQPVKPAVKDPGFIDNLKGAFREDKVGTNASKPVTVKKDKDFGRSLLEEKVDSVSVNTPKVSTARIDQIEDVIKKLSFSITSDNQNRLRTIIQLNLKDIRNKAQTREVIERPIIEGGLELKPSQADELMGLLDIEHSKAVPMKDVEDIPTVYKEPPVPAKGTPFNSFVHSSKAGVKTTKKKIIDFKEDKLDQLIKQRRDKKVLQTVAVAGSVPLRPASHVKLNHKDNTPPSKEIKQQTVDKIVKSEPRPVFKLNTQASVKTVMHDVAPPTANKTVTAPDEREVDIIDKEYGPVGEIQNMSLIDFRRLSANPTEAAARLQQKLFNLRDESYLMYLKGLDAWVKSQLYIAYMQAIDTSLAERKSISDVVSAKPDSINLNEITALVKMEEQL